MDNKNIYNEVDRIPYTYLIGWTKFNIWYYGVRYRKGCHPNDLWVKYFTSSKFVKEFIKEHGEPDVIEVRRIFKDKNKAVIWEYKVLKRINVINNPKWLNKSYFGGGKINYQNGCSEQTRKKMSESAKKRLEDPIEKEKRMIMLLDLNHSRKGMTLSEEHKQKISESHIGLCHTESSKKKMSESKIGRTPWNKGIPRTDEEKKKISDSKKGKKLGPQSEEHIKKRCRKRISKI